YKGVRRKADQPVELYDVTTDIGERDDLSAANPAIVKKVLAAFKEAHIPSPHWKPRVPRKKSPRSKPAKQ
ncbi:MAG: hypothetical protein MK479_10635, partial [Planctomycetes bacterium]|nr:hypothetical protein [Planctomycetota bacterium]